MLTAFTGALVAVGLLQAVVLAFTIRAINQQTTSNQNVERAWIMAEIDWDREKWADGKGHVLHSSGTEGDSTGMWIILICNNEGKSPAWIYEKRMKYEITKKLNPVPDFDSAQFVWEGREPIGIGQAYPHTTKVPQLAIAEGRAKADDMLVIYGIVKYRDIFSKDRGTTVGYRVTDRKLERLSEVAYNRST